MGQDFYRRVEGYNLPFYVFGSGSLARNATLTLNAPAGPGKVEKVFVMVYVPATEQLYDDYITLNIDGVNIITYCGYLMLLTYERVNVSGPILSRIASTIVAQYQFVADWDYESSLSLAITNIYSPNPTSYSIVIWGRKGA
jgi:hypothetical protein